MVRGCLNWQAKGLNPPESVLAATRDYRDAEDQMAGFLEECANESSELWVSTGDLRSSLEVWCKRNGNEVPSTNALTGRLRRRSFVAEKRSRKRGWRGLDLTAEARSGLHERGSQ